MCSAVDGQYHGKCDLATLDRLGVATNEVTWSPAHNRGYCNVQCPLRLMSLDDLALDGHHAEDHTFWSGELNDGRARGSEYHCPSGWYRHAIAPPAGVADVCFTGHWKLMYHGTRADFVHKIIR